MMPQWVRRGASAWALALAIAAVLVATVKRPGRLESLLRLDVLLSREQRLIHFFGDCEPAGYGYVKRVLEVYARYEPDPRRRPLIRYGDYDHKTEYLFEPTRFEADPSVMIGVGVRDVDTRERLIREAARHKGGAFWQLSMETDVDRLTRLEAELEGSVPADVRLVLYMDERATTPMWTARGGQPETMPPGARDRRLEFMLPPSLGAFRTRATPLAIRFDDAARVRTLTAYGVPVVLDDYDVVTRNGACFTAVMHGHEARWARFIDALKQWRD